MKTAVLSSGCVGVLRWRSLPASSRRLALGRRPWGRAHRQGAARPRRPTLALQVLHVGGGELLRTGWTDRVAEVDEGDDLVGSVEPDRVLDRAGDLRIDHRRARAPRRGQAGRGRGNKDVLNTRGNGVL